MLPVNIRHIISALLTPFGLISLTPILNGILDLVGKGFNISETIKISHFHFL
jgi:hypothetical protein